MRTGTFNRTARLSRASCAVRTSTIFKRLAAAVALGAATAGTVGIGFAPAAHADSSGSSTLVGETATVQSVAVQYAFNIPGVFPLPGDNLIEDDVPFARTTVSQGPVINALGAPYYPGDILANFGGLIAEFGGPKTFPNDPLLAMADYPPTPSHGTDVSFGGNPPAGSPIAPNVFSSTAHAGQDGANVTATLTDVQAGPPSSTSSQVMHLGPPTSSVAPGATTSPLLDIGSVQATNQVTLADSAISGTASSVLKAIDLAGVLDISQVTSAATATSDGNTGQPNAALHMLGVTVDGQPAYIDNQGVHVSGNTVAPDGVTPQQAQNTLNTTFAQDGITVRLLDPETNTNGSEGIASAGGLQISISHQFAVPYVPGEPTVPLPALGNQALPAGTYTATTSITLGASAADVQANQVPGAGSTASSTLGGAGGDLGLGTSSLGGSLGDVSGGLPTTGGSLGSASSGLGGNGAPGSEALGARTASRLPLGIPAPLGWLVVGLILCVIFAYPMLLAVRWQFLSGRGR